MSTMSSSKQQQKCLVLSKINVTSKRPKCWKVNRKLLMIIIKELYKSDYHSYAIFRMANKTRQAIPYDCKN